MPGPERVPGLRTGFLGFPQISPLEVLQCCGLTSACDLGRMGREGVSQTHGCRSPRAAQRDQ